jgi:hypothetical protein
MYPVLLENDVFMLSLSTKYKTEEVESFHTIDEVYYFSLLPQQSVLTALFTTEMTLPLNSIKKSRKYY